MQELFHRLLLAGNKLHVIHQQDVRLAVLAAQLGEALPVLGAGRVNKLIGELFARDVHHIRGGILVKHLMADGLEQVRFPHAGLPVQEKGIEQGPFRLGDGQPCLIGKAAVFINHEGIERVQIIQ